MFPSRYLTKLCDQIDCLISDEHSTQLLWKDEDATKISGDDEYNSFDDRMFGYTVEQTNEEEESAEAEDGFIVSIVETMSLLIFIGG